MVSGPSPTPASHAVDGRRRRIPKGEVQRQVILDGILSTFEEDSLLLISTHLIHDLEPILDSVVMMRHGSVVLAGEADDLRAAHGASLDDIFKETYR